MYRSRKGFLGITSGFSGRMEVGGEEEESTAAKESIKGGGGGCRKLTACEGRLLMTTGTKGG